MKKKLMIISLFMLGCGLINADWRDPKPVGPLPQKEPVPASLIPVEIIDDRPIGNPPLFIGYKMEDSDQSYATNIGKIETKSSKGASKNRFMIPRNAKAMTFDKTQKRTGNTYMSYQAGQGYIIKCNEGICARDGLSTVEAKINN